MATIVPDMPAERPEGFGSDLAGMASFLIDPAGAAKRVFSKWFWVGPVVVLSIVSIIASVMMMPIVQHVLETAPIPQGSTPEQYQKGIEMGLMVQKIGIFCTPLIIAGLFAIGAGVLMGMSTVTGVNTKFRQLFNLVAGCGLIQTLSAIAGLVVVKLKGDVSTMAELRPALGLDIFMPEGSNKVLTAILGYFTVFEVWWIVMMILIYSVAFRVTKGKAFLVILPLILLNMIFRVVGALAQR